MANPFLIRAGYDDDDEEKKKPSQIASQVIKEKSNAAASNSSTPSNPFLLRVQKEKINKKSSYNYKPPIQETKVVEPQKSFTQKAGDFLKSGAQTVSDTTSKAVEVAKTTDYRSLFNTTKQLAGNALIYTKNAITSQVDKENKELQAYKAKKGIPDDALLSFDEQRDYGSTGMLTLQKEDKQKQLTDLEAKPKKSWLDNIRINNYKKSIEQIDEVIAMSPEEKKKKEFFILTEGLERTSSNVFSSFMGLGASSLSGISWLSNKKNQLTGTNPEEQTFVSQYSEAGAKRLNAWSKVVSPSNPQLGDSLVQGIASTVPFYVSGMGISSLTAKLTTFSPQLATLFGLTASALLESGTEAGAAYQENLEQGKSREDADSRANNVFAGNVVFNTITNKFGLFNDAEGVKKAIISAGGEGTQEAYQQALSNINTDRPIDEGVSESFMMSLLTGGVISSVVTTASTDPSLSKQDQTKLKEVAAQIQEEKIPETRPEVKAEIKQAIDTTIEDTIDEKEVSTEIEGSNTFTYTPEKKLSPESAKVEQTFGKYLTENLETAEKTYTEKFGNVLNTDNARELSDDYNADRSRLSPAVHEPASSFIQQLYEKKLQESPAEGQMNTVLFTAGGTGAGKTTAINTKPEFANTANAAQIVYDTNLSTFDSSKKKIEQALDAGKTVKIMYVLRDPLDAMMNGAVPRANRMGRTVPIDVHVDTHIKSLATIQSLAEEYKDNKSVKITVLDNSYGKGGALQVPIDSLKNIKYDKDAITKDVKNNLKTLYTEGKISEAIYEGFSGGTQEVRGVEQETRSTSAGQSQQSNVQKTSEELNKELQKIYTETDQQVLEDEFTDIWRELDFAEAGTRFFNEEGNFSTPSTFPDWVPEELRSRKLFDKVLSGFFDFSTLAYPPAQNVRQQELYDVILAEIDERIGTDSSTIIQEIKDSYAREKQEKTQTSADKSTSRSQETKTDSQEKVTSKIDQKIEKYLSTRNTVKFRELDTSADDTLLQEARKYKSAEEFIQAQGTPVYHGGNKLRDTFDISKAGSKESNRYGKEGFWFSSDPNTAKGYGKQVTEAYPNLQKPKIIDAEGQMFTDMREVLDDAVPLAKKEGFDGVIVKNMSDEKNWGQYNPTDHYLIFNPEQIKTRSQLTDIYNQANKSSDLTRFNGRTINLSNKDDIAYLQRIFSKEVVSDMQNGIFKYARYEGKKSLEDIVKANIVNKPDAINYKKEAETIEKMGKLLISKKEISVYHGGNKTFTDQLLSGKGFDPQADREAGTGGNFYGLSTTTDPQMAKDFSHSSSGSDKASVIELQIKKGSRVLELSNKNEEFVDEFSEESLKELSKKYDVILDKNNSGGESEIRILNPNSLKQTKQPFSREMFRVKDDVKSFTGKEITDQQEAEIIALNKNIFGDDNVKITLQIMANKKALGSSKDGMISIVSGQVSPKDTFYHESVHKFIDIFTTREEQTELFKAGIEKYKTEDLFTVEEKIAEDFIAYAKSREGITGSIRTLIDKIMSRINLYLGNSNEIDALYEKILSPAEKKTVSTPEGRANSQYKPVADTTGKMRASQSYEKIKDRLDEAYQDSKLYKQMNIKENAERAFDFVEKFPEQAKRIAKGYESAPEGVTEIAIGIALAEKAEREGDKKLQAEIESAVSLRGTREGQNIVSFRGRINKGVSDYVKEIMKVRLERSVGYFNNLKFEVNKDGKIKSKSEKAIEMIDKKAKELKRRIDKETLSKLKSAQDILDNLTCKI